MSRKSFVFRFLAGVGIVTVAALGLAGCAAVSQEDTAQPQQPAAATKSHSQNGDQTIVDLLEPIRQKYKVPAICAAIVNSEGLVAVGAVGLRKVDIETPVTIDDVWHLGSDTKAMTASMIGRLVEQGKLRWDSTLAEIFPELAPTIRPELKEVTMLQLLSHWAGLDANDNWQSYSQMGTPQQQRYEGVKKAVSEQPKYTPGSGYHYSNLGYVVAGAVIEKVTGSSWEEQIKTLLFDPLQMTTASFGGVGTLGRLDQPWGHDDNGRPVAFNGPAMDNPPVLGPAGRVHCTIQDWAKFVIDQLKGAMEKPALLKTEAYKKIQSPPFGGDSALGWLAVQRDWGGGMVLNHCGSNTMNYANVWIAPHRDFAILVCINQGGDTAFNATDEVVATLISVAVKK